MSSHTVTGDLVIHGKPEKRWTIGHCDQSIPSGWAALMMDCFPLLLKARREGNFYLTEYFFLNKSESRNPPKPISSGSLSDRSHTSISQEDFIKAKVNFLHCIHQTTANKHRSVPMSKKERMMSAFKKVTSYGALNYKITMPSLYYIKFGKWQRVQKKTWREEWSIILSSAAISFNYNR